MKRLWITCVLMAAMGGLVRGDVFNMGPGLTSLETVHVGNPGNAADDTGYGSVAYEYNIGKYEVTAGQYCEFLNAVATTDTYGLYNTNMDVANYTYGCNIKRSGSSGTYSYSVETDWANRPVNFVSWGDSARFANWLHNGQPTGPQGLATTENGAYYLNGETSDAALLAVNRETKARWAITSENEWYKAAYYNPITGSYFDYPTSSNTAPGYVNNSGNLSGTGNLFVESGTDPGNYATYDGDGSTDGIGSPYHRTAVGEWENSDSPYGTFDQGGNIWEWTEAILYGSYRGLRGGSFVYRVYDLHASDRDNYVGSPTFEYGSLGFRVSEVPEPATVAVLAFGAVALMRRRSRSRVDL